jgi:uncharacterized protein
MIQTRVQYSKKRCVLARPWQRARENATTITVQMYVNQDLYPGEFLFHKKLASSDLLLDLIWTHSNITVEIALDLYSSGKFDISDLPREYVIQAGLLFDMGVYHCAGYEHFPGQPAQEKPYIQHTVVGAWLLKQSGYAPQIIQVAHSHAGVGITPEDIKLYGLQLPEADYTPRSKLEQLICYATKFHSKAPKFKTDQEVRDTLKKFGKDKIHRFNEFEEYFGKPNIPALEEKYREWHQGFTYKLQQLEQMNAGKPIATGPVLSSAGVSQPIG